MFKGYACFNPREALIPHNYDPGTLGLNEVEVRISHCGICHSDIHLIDNDWGISQYPFIPGHEIIGTVTATGSAVTGLKPGLRVGVGWQRGSCGTCEYCISGRENLCDAQTATCVANNGGYADSIRVDHRFAIPIPDAMESAGAAPLLCGGITVYSPFVTHGITARHKVGVLGIGGLGHLALQFARAFGCEVTALSGSGGKEEEAKSFGATHFVLTSDPDALARAASSLDFIISSVSGDVDMGMLISLLRPNGKICIVGASSNPINLPAAALIGRRYQIVGSNIGAPSEIADMLKFAARNGIRAKTELIKMADVNNALDKVRANKARYRIVLEN